MRGLMRRRLALFALVVASCREPAPRGGAAEPRAAEEQGAPEGQAQAPAPSSPASAAPTSPSGGAEEKPSQADGRARVYAKGRFTWIYQGPSERSGWIGYLTLGGSAPLRGGTRESSLVSKGATCSWHALEGRGFVCAGGLEATLDPDDPVFVEALKGAPDLSSPWPFSYGESIGAPRYPALPSRAEQLRAEAGLDAHLALVARLRAAGAREVGVTFPPLVPKLSVKPEALLDGVDLELTGTPAPTLVPMSPFVREARAWVVRGSTIAYQRSFDHEGRAFVETADRALVPRDRVIPYPKSQFEGLPLREGATLPLAFARERARPLYRREGATFAPTGETLARHGHAFLTGQEVVSERKRYLETKTGAWLAADDVTVLTKSRLPVSWLLDPKRGRGTWLDVSVLGGWLVAYEREVPVFATLISPGRGGVPIPGVDPLDTASTPLGTFRVDGKFQTATMVSSSNSDIVHAEVNWVMNFHGPHALHGAYWHDVWGEPRSGGCINLSPKDGKRIFAWTAPPMPEGWHGMRSTADLGDPTVVHVHR